MSATEQDKLIYHTTSTLISASAGTGKTYQLVSRYIALLMLGIEPEKIIALTFTRKAAGEFRGRILHALAEGACDLRDEETNRNMLAARIWEVWSGLSMPDNHTCNAASNDTPLLPATAAIVRRAAAEGKFPEDLYANEKELQEYLKIPTQTAKDFTDLLKKVVKAMSKLELSTIDSFFNTLVAGNSLDLGVNNVSSIDPADEQKVKRSTINDYLDANNTELKKRSDFIKMYAELTGGKGGKTIARLEQELQNHLSLYRENPNLDAWVNDSYFKKHSSAPFEALNEEEAAEWTKDASRLNDLLLNYKDSDFATYVYSGLKKLAKQEPPLSSTLKKWVPKNLDEYTLFYDDLAKLYSSFEQCLPWSEELEATANEVLRLAPSLFQTKKDIDALNSLITKLQKKNFTPTGKTGIIAEKVQQNQIVGMTELISLSFKLTKALPAKCLYDAKTRTRSLFSLLRDYADTYEQRLISTGEFSFDDIARKAHELMTKEVDADEVDDAAYCREHLAIRTGKKYHHWMLDEFQDTSDAQFATLAPVLEFALGEQSVPFTTNYPRPLPASLRPYHKDTEYFVSDGSLFVVGDDKQGIYGFRTGETQAFNDLKTKPEWSTPIKSANLTKSFRSSPIIMGKDGFVNELFRKLNATEQADGADLAVNMEDFTHHETAKNTPGYVEMRVIAKEAEEATDFGEEQSMKERAYEELGNVMKRLTVGNKTPINGISIGILTRSNSEAEDVVNYLRNEMPELPVLLVKDTLAAIACPLGEMLHHLFRWLNHPHEKTSCSILKASFMSYLFHNRTTDEAWLEQRETLDLNGYSHFLTSVFAMFPICSMEEEQQTAHKKLMTTWLNAARAFDATGGDLSTWIDHIAALSTQGVASSRYVQVMTMHKSKGLEFDAVILPFMSDDAIDNEAALKYFRSPDGASLMLSPGNADVREEYWPGAFTGLHNTWKHRQCREEYNLLYVAVTRARHANYILLNGNNISAENKCRRSLAGLIRRAMGGKEDAYTETELLCDPMGDAAWYEFLNKNTASAQETMMSLELGAGIPHRKHVSPSKMAAEEDKQQTEAEDKPARVAVYGGSADGAEFGTKVHKTWEQILWLDAAGKLPFSAPLNDEQTVVHNALQQAEVKALFTHQTGQEVYNEQAVEAINEKDEWVSATIDRLVLTYDEAGQVVAAHIIDFKTNKPGPRDGYDTFESWLLEHYAPQMCRYRQLISDAFNLPTQAIAVSLISCPKEAPAQVLTYTENRL